MVNLTTRRAAGLVLSVFELRLPAHVDIAFQRSGDWAEFGGPLDSLFEAARINP